MRERARLRMSCDEIGEIVLRRSVILGSLQWSGLAGKRRQAEPCLPEAGMEIRNYLRTAKRRSTQPQPLTF